MFTLLKKLLRITLYVLVIMFLLISLLPYLFSLKNQPLTTSFQPYENSKYEIHGEYFVQTISGTRELVGSDVNLIHRLTKNHLSEQTGWRAYAMFTAQALACGAVVVGAVHRAVCAFFRDDVDAFKVRDGH